MHANNSHIIYFLLSSTDIEFRHDLRDHRAAVPTTRCGENQHTNELYRQLIDTMVV